MNRSRKGLTWVGILAVVVGTLTLIALAGLLLVFLSGSRERARRNACKMNLQTIGRAMAAYRNDNYGYFPFSWGPGDSAPKAFNNAAASSLGFLYGKYVQNGHPFRCPSTEDEPEFVPNGEGSNQTWALDHSSYGYDPRVSQHAGRKVVVMADMDGMFSYSRDSGMQNHANAGANVLYADGYARWAESWDSNFTSANPTDNIFAEDPWDADTDTFLVRGDLNNLTVSFDGYDHLK